MNSLVSLFVCLDGVLWVFGWCLSIEICTATNYNNKTMQSKSYVIACESRQPYEIKHIEHKTINRQKYVRSYVRYLFRICCFCSLTYRLLLPSSSANRNLFAKTFFKHENKNNSLQFNFGMYTLLQLDLTHLKWTNYDKCNLPEFFPFHSLRSNFFFLFIPFNILYEA